MIQNNSFDCKYDTYLLWLSILPTGKSLPFGDGTILSTKLYLGIQSVSGIFYLFETRHSQVGFWSKNIEEEMLTKKHYLTTCLS